jgi:hypothetical protein
METAKGYIATSSFCWMLGVGLAWQPLPGILAEELLPHSDLFPLLQDRLADVDETTFDLEAGAALFKQFRDRILLDDDFLPYEPDAPAIVMSRRFDGPCSYVRIGRVHSGLVTDLKVLLEDAAFLEGTKGLILDLRFAGGLDYASAGEVANLFVSSRISEDPLLDWGLGQTFATQKQRPWSLPLIILVNSKTLGAAEAIAACLRVEQVAIVLGNPTAGRAAIYESFILSSGVRVHLATHRVRAGNQPPIPADGWIPDILVAVDPQHERVYLSDPFTPVTGTVSAAAGTNIVVSAIRVRGKPAEQAPSTGGTGNSPPPPKSTQELKEHPTVRDPVLARALDVLKNLAILGR